MQQDTEQKGDANTPASPSHDSSMNDKRKQARQAAEELIAEEQARGKPRSMVTTYLVAMIVGLAIWAAIYFLWRAL